MPNAIALRRGPVATFTGGGYDATEDRGRRRAPRRANYAEDRVATAQKRRILSATTADLTRNFAIAAWAIRKHLDYVASFTFHAKTPDRSYNKYLQEQVELLSEPQSFDLLRRHDRYRGVRLAEACRSKDGDCLWLKNASPFGTRNRGTIQAFESDRIIDPAHAYESSNRWVNGVQLNSVGATIAYNVGERSEQGSQIVNDRRVRVGNTIFHATYNRYDQVRGITPITAALNAFQDVYEGFEYALAKAKIAQLFGIKITRDGDLPLDGKGSARPTKDPDCDGVNSSGYEINLNRGPFQLDLLPGDDAGILEGATPASETVDFLKLMIHVALTSLDLPFSFFDASFTNFYGSRGSLIQYLKSCKHKILDMQRLQDQWTAWRLGLAVVDGQLELPAGRMFDYIEWEWVPDGVPWWDPVKEARGQAMSVAAAFTNPERVCREIGTDVYDNIDRIAAVEKYAEEKGVTLKYADSTAFNPEVSVSGEEEPEQPPASGEAADSVTEETENG